MASYVPSKDPDNVEPYFFLWCSTDGTNDGTTSDSGELQGATISTIAAASVVSGDVTVDSSNKNAVTIAGVSYAINTVVTVWLSGGTVGTDCEVLCRITTSDSRTLDKTMIVPIRGH